MKKSKYIDLRTPEGRQQFYQSKEWRAIRLVALTRNPYCVVCLTKGITTLGTEIDHVQDIKDAPERCLDITNLQNMCKPCHSSKTMKSNMYGAIHTKFESAQKKWNF